MTMTTIKMTANISLTKTKVEAIRRLAHTNMRMILRQMNFKGSDFGDRLVGCCPIPHKSSGSPNDNNKAFSWDFSRQMWQCFSHRCHNIHGADVFALVRAYRHCNFREAIDWILKVINRDLNDKRMEDEIMRHLAPSNYLLNRGFSKEAIQEFRAGGEWHKAGTYGEGRAVVPIYDPLDGYLIAFTCRILDDSKIEAWRPKWCHTLNFAEIRKKSTDRTDEERFYASSVLFNLHRAKEHMGENKTIIITEGPLDVMRLWEAGIKNAVAILGTGFSKQHKTLLHKIGCQRIVCLLDSDDAGQKATSGVEKLCKGYFDYVAVKIPGNKDPGETDPTQLRMFLRGYL
jgi:hypothetical protein